MSKYQVLGSGVYGDINTEQERQVWDQTFSRLTQGGKLEDEKAALAAWGAVWNSRRSVSYRGHIEHYPDRVIVKGWGILYQNRDDPNIEEKLDSYDTFFSHGTVLLADYYKNAPLWYEHGFDPAYGWRPIGRRTDLKIFGHGVWVEHELYQDHPCFARTLREVEQGLHSYSSDSVEHYVSPNADMMSGEMVVWPLVGLSLTKHPAEVALGPVKAIRIDGGLTQQGEKRYTEDNSPMTAGSGSGDNPGEGATVRTEQGTAQASGLVDLVLSIRAKISNQIRLLRGKNSMDPQMLQDLATFLGVEATPEAVSAALEELLAVLEMPAEADADTADRSGIMDGLRSALSLEAEDGNDQIVVALRGMIELVNTPQDEGGRTYDFDALRRFSDAADQAPSRPAPPPVTPAVRNRGGWRNGHVPNVNYNHYDKAPGLGELVLAATGRMPDSMRNAPGITDTRSAVRALTQQVEPRSSAYREYDSNDGPRGAYVLNNQVAEDIIEPLRSQEVVLAAGAQEIPMNGIDTLTLPKNTGAPTAYWSGENESTTETSDDFDRVQLSLKELRCLYRMPNKFLRNLTSQGAATIQKNAIKSVRLAMDKGFLLGTGAVPGAGHTGAEPLGLINIPGVTTSDKSGAALTLEDLQTLEDALTGNNVELFTENCAFITRPNVLNQFRWMIDMNGQPVFRENFAERAKPTIAGWNTASTTGIPSASSQTDFFAGDWSELAVGIGSDIEVLISEHTYAHYNQTLVVIVVYTDVAAFRPEAFYVAENVLG